MKKSTTYELQNLIEQIESADKMVKAHKGNTSSFMRAQYEAEKEELLSKLIDELVDSDNRSQYSFKLILMAITKFYPELFRRSAGSRVSGHLRLDKHYKELKGLESVLA
jgi:hypothetical protein